MPRLPHGINFTPEDARNARKAVDDRIADVSLGFAMVKPVDLRRFDFLFLRLQEDPDNLLPESQDTVEALEALGKAMVEEGEVGSPSVAGPGRLHLSRPVRRPRYHARC